MDDNELIYSAYASINNWDMENEIDKIEHDIILSIKRENNSIIGEANVRFIPKLGSINVYSDHGCPHCHIKIGDKEEIKVRIDNFEILHGTEMNSKQRKAFNNFLDNEGKNLLKKYWNKMNPQNPLP